MRITQTTYFIDDGILCTLQRFKPMQYITPISKYTVRFINAHVFVMTWTLFLTLC